MAEKDPPGLISHVSAERRSHTFSYVSVIADIEEVSRHRRVRMVGMCMYGRHFHDDKRRLGETDELNLCSYEERSGRRGFYREKIAEIVNVHDSSRRHGIVSSIP